MWKLRCYSVPCSRFKQVISPLISSNEQLTYSPRSIVAKPLSAFFCTIGDLYGLNRSSILALYSWLNSLSIRAAVAVPFH